MGFDRSANSRRSRQDHGDPSRPPLGRHAPEPWGHSPRSDRSTAPHQPAAAIQNPTEPVSRRDRGATDCRDSDHHAPSCWHEAPPALVTTGEAAAAPHQGRTPTGARCAVAESRRTLCRAAIPAPAKDCLPPPAAHQNEGSGDAKSPARQAKDHESAAETPGPATAATPPAHPQPSDQPPATTCLGATRHCPRVLKPAADRCGSAPRARTRSPSRSQSWADAKSHARGRTLLC